MRIMQLLAYLVIPSNYPIDLNIFIFTYTCRYGSGTLTKVFVDRVFQECLTYDGEMVSNKTVKYPCIKRLDQMYSRAQVI